MASVGCDRRILKAFYTQYVAVLLILLTFCIGAYQRKSTAPPPIPQAEVASLPDVILQGMEIAGLFSGETLLSSEEPRLAAVASILKSHDLNATVSLSIDRSVILESSARIKRAVARAESIERFLKTAGVKEEAFQIRLVFEGGDAEQVSVSFIQPSEASHEKL
jgi:hypothetical protein